MFLYISGTYLTIPVLHVGAVDMFDEFLEPFAGPRAGHNGVSISNVLIRQTLNITVSLYYRHSSFRRRR